MRCITKYLLATICFLFILSAINYAQLALKIDLESGVHLSSNNSLENQTNSIHRILGSAKYKFKRKNLTTSLFLKVRPEIFDVSINSIKLNPKGLFVYYTEGIIWRSVLSIQHNSYNFLSKKSYYNTFTFVNGTEFNINKKTPINISLGYSYQKINFGNTINSDFLFLNALASKQINNYLTSSYGLFVQKFTTESELGNRDQVIKSNGWMYGPQIKIHYLKNFVLDAEYKFLLENSNHIAYPSYEHQVKLLGGIILNKNFSFFLLIDFHFRRIKINDNTAETNPILFLPTKNENQITLKTSYRLGKNVSLYFKTGYFRENLFLNNFKFEGLNILLGLEFRN